MVINPSMPPWFKSERSEVTHTQQRLLRKLVGATYVMHFKVARRACARKILCNGSLRKSLCKSKDTHEENLI